MTESAQTQRTELEEFLDPGFLDLDQVLDAVEREVAPTEGLLGGSGLALRACEPGARKLAVAISGGGAAGAYSAGLLEVLLDRLRQRGIEIDLLVGTSSGAVNGYGVFVEALGKGNPQFAEDPAVRQPYKSYIASVWSYLARDGKASRWVVGRRSWIIRLASRGVPTRWRNACLAMLLLLFAALWQPALLLVPAVAAAKLGLGSLGWAEAASLAEALPLLAGLALVATVSLAAAAGFALRAFRPSLFRDLPLLRLLANTGPGGDLKRHSRLSRGMSQDQARVLSRELVAAWYRRRDALPEFIATGTDITARRECLFTLVRPETYARLLRREWMAVQFDFDGTKDYRSSPRSLFALPEDFVRAIVASSAVPGAFPSQRIGLYGPESRRTARHRFVDGGVLNNSPVHIAIDAGATHVISLEILPFDNARPLEVDEAEKGAGSLLQSAVAAFTTVLERATDVDIRRTASWNRFLIQRPQSLRKGKGAGRGKQADSVRQRGIVQIYRVAPRAPLVGTVEFDGRFAGGKQTTTLREILRRGIVDMQGRNIWGATTRHKPGWREPD